MKKLITSLAIMFVLIQVVFAQTLTVTISGTVINSINSSPMTNQAVYINADSSNFLVFTYYNTVYTDQNGFYADTIVIPNAPPITFYVSTSNCNGALVTQTVTSSSLPMVANFTIQCLQSCSSGFTVSSDSMNQGMSFIFTDQSWGVGGGTTWYWDFGDGTTSYVQNTNHVYTSPGWYNVCHTIATIQGCTSTYCDSVHADTTNAGNCQASFQYSVGNATVYFYGYSNNFLSSFFWNFGDGSSSTLQNPTHVYNLLGSYTVCLTITTSTGCTDTYCQVVTTGNPTGGCPVSFYAYVDSTNYLLYHFNISNGLPNYLTCSWTFGDGATSTLTNPSHLYANLGGYSVCVFVYDSLSNILCSYCDSILVDTSNTIGCQAYYQYTVSGTSVSFYGYAGANVATYSWSFGDGTGSTLQNPVHQYGSNGTYYVCLTIATSNGCTNTYCQNVVVGNNLTCSAYFYMYPDSLTPHVYYAVNMATGAAPISYIWNWGDGTTDTGAYPSHTYSSPGFYGICLTITDYVGCTNTVCDSFYMQKNTNNIITVYVIPSSGTGITEINADGSTSAVYPNPVSGDASINITLFKANTINVILFDILGQETISYQVAASAGNYKLPVKSAGLKEGMYTIRLSTTDGLKVSRKFIKID